MQKQVESMFATSQDKIFQKVDAYRRVPEDWLFPNKMTLRAVWHRYILLDHASDACPLKYLTATDLKN